MIKLAPVDFLQIQKFFVDYQKKSKNFEMPPDNAEFLGIFKNTELIGYFITVAYVEDKTVEINQGYLIPEFRHKHLSEVSMKLLEDVCKKVGIEKITLGTNRAVGSYIRFMNSMDYKIERAIFSKELR